MTREQHLETLIAHTRARVADARAMCAHLRVLINQTDAKIKALRRTHAKDSQPCAS